MVNEIIEPSLGDEDGPGAPATVNDPASTSYRTDSRKDVYNTRFISSNYYAPSILNPNIQEISEYNGGLNSASAWLQNDEYARTLAYALEKTINSVDASGNTTETPLVAADDINIFAIVYSEKEDSPYQRMVKGNTSTSSTWEMELKVSDDEKSAMQSYLQAHQSDTNETLYNNFWTIFIMMKFSNNSISIFYKIFFRTRHYSILKSSPSLSI